MLMMTDEQREWVREHRKITFMRARVTYDQPESAWRRKVHYVATSSGLEYAMLTCIVLNAVFMGMEHYNMSDDLVGTLAVANLTLTVIFTMEAVIKLVQARPSLAFDPCYVQCRAHTPIRLQEGFEIRTEKSSKFGISRAPTPVCCPINHPPRTRVTQIRCMLTSSIGFPGGAGRGGVFRSAMELL
jgi:hypothetical protein